MPALADPSTKDPPPDSLAERKLVVEHVRHDWRRSLGESECEDVVSEAYVALLERLRRGEPPDNRIAWLKTTAWQIANDAHRRNRRRATDGDDGKLDRLPAPAPSPEDYVDLRDLDGRLKEAYRQLPKQLRLALATEFADGMTWKQACRRCRCVPSTLLVRRRKAREYLYTAATAENPRFDDAVIALMAVCLAGAATAEQRERVRELKARSPYYAARFAELRAVDHRLPAIVPPIAFVGPAMLERAGSALGNMRDAAHSLLVRNPESADAATAPALASGAGKVGGATAGGVGGVLSSLGGAKLVVGCLSGAAAASACVAAVVGVPRINGGGDKPAPIEREANDGRDTVRRAPSTPVRVEPAPATNPAAAHAGAPQPSSSDEEKANDDDGDSSSAPSEPAPSQETPGSDFSFSSDGSTASPTPETRVPTSSPPTSSTSESTSGGGSADGSSDGGDFSFGSP